MWSQLDLLVGDRKRLIAAVCVLSFVTAVIEAALIVIIAQVGADLVSGANGKRAQSRNSILHFHAPVGTLLWIGLGLTVVRFALQWPSATLPSRITTEVQQGLRRRTFRAFTRASWDVQSRDREGSLQEVMTQQTNMATGGAMQATGLLNLGLTFLVLMASAVVLSPTGAGFVFVLAIAMFAVLRPMRSLGRRRSRELSRSLVHYSTGIAEANRLAEEAHVFGVAEAQFKRVDALIKTCRELFYRTQLIGRLVPGFYQGLLYIMLIVALWGLYEFGGHHNASLVAVILLLFRGAQNGQSIQSNYQSLQQSLPFIERLRSVQERYSASAPPDGDKPLSVVRSIAFEEVSFEYNPDVPVLKGISFAVEGGETIGIIGPSGAGKSTLIQILLQLRPPVEGRYLVNGTPVHEYVRADWHKLVAYVPQEPRLLHASVAENIRFFRSVDDESVERAGRLARIHDDIMSWPHGYETIIGPRADAVSGGQQQRICLARALAARPHMLVLDEPTSALDPHSEKLIGESLAGLREELTLFIIAHRLSTLDRCDRVMVILDGRLAAFDTKALLQQSDPYYRSASKIARGAVGETLPDAV